MAIETRVLKNARASYVVRVRDRLGNWFPARNFHRKADAEQYEREILSKRDEGIHALSRSVRGITVSEYWSEWCEVHRMRVSDGWKITQEQMARDYLLPSIGQQKLGLVSSYHIGGILAELKTKGRAPATQLTMYAMMHRFFQCAADDGLISGNPVVKAFKPHVPEVTRKFLSPDSLWKLLAASESHFLGTAIWLASLAGLRCEAIQALQWNAIDFETGQILICRGYKRKVDRIDNFPKGKRSDYVPMAQPLADYLRQKKCNSGADDFVAAGQHGGMLNYRVFFFGLKRLCKKAGVDEVTPHGLRHSCTELFVDHGASMEDLRRLLNHKDAKITQRYVHRTPQRLRALAAQIKRPPVIEPARPNLQLVKETLTFC